MGRQVLGKPCSAHAGQTQVLPTGTAESLGHYRPQGNLEKTSHIQNGAGSPRC